MSSINGEFLVSLKSAGAKLRSTRQGTLCLRRTKKWCRADPFGRLDGEFIKTAQFPAISATAALAKPRRKRGRGVAFVAAGAAGITAEEMGEISRALSQLQDVNLVPWSGTRNQACGIRQYV